MPVYLVLAVTLLNGLFLKAHAITGEKNKDSEPIKLVNPLGDGTTLEMVVVKVSEGLTIVAIPVVGIMFVIGGIMMMTAGGDTERFRTGRRVLTYAGIGFAVILLATSVVAVIRDVLGAPTT